MRGANGARGEVVVTLAGEPARLCLTLGALAEVETALEISEGARLADRLKSVGARDVAAILVALLKGGGSEESDAVRVASAASPDEAARAIAAGFEAAART